MGLQSPINTTAIQTSIYYKAWRSYYIFIILCKCSTTTLSIKHIIYLINAFSYNFTQQNLPSINMIT